MSIRIPSGSQDSRGFIFCIIFFFGSFPGRIVTQEVTLDSILIFKTHEWFSTKPIVYFHCKGENKTLFPDVKTTNVSYSFNGHESWQPLTQLKGTKCKRCGIYEEDTFRYDTFNEWELCPSDFTPEGTYTHAKDKDFNATFLCHGCSQLGAGFKRDYGTDKEEETHRRMHPAIAVLILVLVLGVAAVVIVLGYNYWRMKKQQQQEEARFLKLFEDGDEMEDELGFGDTL